MRRCYVLRFAVLRLKTYDVKRTPVVKQNFDAVLVVVPNIAPLTMKLHTTREG